MKKLYIFLTALICMVLLGKISADMIKKFKSTKKTQHIDVRSESTGMGLTIYYKISYPVALGVPKSSGDGFAVEILQSIFPYAKFVPFLENEGKLSDILNKDPHAAIIAPETIDRKRAYPTGKVSLGNMGFALYRLRDPKYVPALSKDIIAYPEEFNGAPILEELAKKSVLEAVYTPHYLVAVQQKMLTGEISGFIAHYENFLWSIENTNIKLIEFFKCEKMLYEQVPVKIFFSPLDMKYADMFINWSDEGIKKSKNQKTEVISKVMKKNFEPQHISCTQE